MQRKTDLQYPMWLESPNMDVGLIVLLKRNPE